MRDHWRSVIAVVIHETLDTMSRWACYEIEEGCYTDDRQWPCRSPKAKPIPLALKGVLFVIHLAQHGDGCADSDLVMVWGRSRMKGWLEAEGCSIQLKTEAGEILVKQ